MAKERWLPVVGFEGFYEVSDCGRVRGVDRILSDGRNWKGKLLFQKTDKGGHKSVRLCINKFHFFRGVHCLVLTAFVGSCPDGMQGAHNDGVPHHNRLKNLRWDTPKGNTADRYKHGTIKFGETNSLAKLTRRQVSSIKKMRRDGVIYKVIGARFGITAANACSIALGHTWKAVQ